MQNSQNFVQKNSVNSAWHFLKFCGSLHKITVISAIDSQMKEIQFLHKIM